MKNLKKFLGVFVFVVAVLLLPNKVSAIENPGDLIKLLAPDGKNAVVKAKKPTSLVEEDFIINGYVQNIIREDGYSVYAYCREDSKTGWIVSIQSDDYEGIWDSDLQETVVVSGWKGEYEINVTYDEPDSNLIVNNLISGLNKFDSSDPDTYYIVEDLSLINYYLTSSKSELWNPGAPGRALRYSTINNTTSGANVTYFLEARAGNQHEDLMFESAFGPMSVFYNGYLHASVEEGLYLKRVIYIPQDTEDSKEAFVEAAQKRINDYLGNDSVVVSYGGLLSSLEEGAEDTDYPIENDGNYYNIKVAGRTYKFYIVKGTEKQLEKPVYEGVDIESKIEITSVDSSIPLDTSLSVKNIIDASIKDKIGTEDYKSYDISLFSDAKGSKIEKLDNGKFLVKIPVPTEFDGKDLIVYYINNDGKVEEHEVSIKEGYAVFETNHFSVYTLAAKDSYENPKTFDGIGRNIFIGAISLISLFGVMMYLKKEEK